MIGDGGVLQAASPANKAAVSSPLPGSDRASLEMNKSGGFTVLLIERRPLFFKTLIDKKIMTASRSRSGKFWIDLQVLDRLERPISQGNSIPGRIGSRLISHGRAARFWRTIKSGCGSMIQNRATFYGCGASYQVCAVPIGSTGERSDFLRAEKRLLTNTWHCCIQTFRHIRKTLSSLAGRWELDLLGLRLDGAGLVPESIAKDSLGQFGVTVRGGPEYLRPDLF